MCTFCVPCIKRVDCEIISLVVAFPYCQVDLPLWSANHIFLLVFCAGKKNIHICWRDLNVIFVLYNWSRIVELIDMPWSGGQSFFDHFRFVRFTSQSNVWNLHALKNTWNLFVDHQDLFFKMEIKEKSLWFGLPSVDETQSIHTTGLTFWTTAKASIPIARFPAVVKSVDIIRCNWSILQLTHFHAACVSSIKHVCQIRWECDEGRLSEIYTSHTTRKILVETLQHIVILYP